jgi:hypothetical protein
MVNLDSNEKSNNIFVNVFPYDINWPYFGSEPP